MLFFGKGINCNCLVLVQPSQATIQTSKIQIILKTMHALNPNEVSSNKNTKYYHYFATKSRRDSCMRACLRVLNTVQIWTIPRKPTCSRCATSNSFDLIIQVSSERSGETGHICGSSRPLMFIYVVRTKIRLKYLILWRFVFLSFFTKCQTTLM